MKKKTINKRTILIFASLLILIGFFAFPKKIEDEDSIQLVNEINSEENFVDFVESLWRDYEDRQRLEDEEEDSTLFLPRIYDGLYVNLNTDIDYSKVLSIAEDRDIESTMISEFSGIFDGNGHKIMNAQIVEDENAAIFHNLIGTVANLVVDESCYFEAENVGNVADYLANTGKILNCAGFGVLEGETTDGIAGYYSTGNAVSINCICNKYAGIINESEVDNSPIEVENLNQGVTTIDEIDEPTGYNRWMLDDDKGYPVLSNERLVTMTSAVCVSDDLGDIQGFYSKNNKSWTIVMPKETGETIDAEIKLSDGSSEIVSIVADGSISRINDVGPDKLKYEFEVEHIDNLPVISVETNTDYALSYIHKNKKNSLTGQYVSLNDGKLEAGVVKEFRGRGNHSWESGKKRGYNLVLSEKKSLCGASPSENYALIGAERDDSLLSYYYNNKLAKAVGMEGVPDTKFVHLYIDGAYMGVYFMTPRIQLGKGHIDIFDQKLETERINFKPLYDYKKKEIADEDSGEYIVGYELESNPSDISGGYIVELNGRDYEIRDARFISEAGRNYVVRSHPYASIQQVEYLKEYWDMYEEGFGNELGINSEGEHFTKYIEPVSFCKQWLMMEINAEQSRSGSIYFYKESELSGDGLIHAVYPWDVEHSYLLESAEEECMTIDMGKDSGVYWNDFLKHPEMLSLIYEVWQAGFRDSVKKVFDTDTEIDSLNHDFEMNSLRWPGSDIVSKSQDIDEFMKKRIVYVDEELEMLTN